MSTDALTYVTHDADRWDLIAAAFYGDPLRYEPLRRANPTVSGWSLPNGITLSIPILDPAPLISQAALPPWRT